MDVKHGKYTWNWDADPPKDHNIHNHRCGWLAKAFSPDTVKLRNGSLTALQQGHGGRAGPGAAGGGRPLR